MKKILAVTVVFISVFFVSCLDTEEKITINKDNSGVYALTIDMGAMIEQLKTIKPEEAASLEGNKDSVILFKSFTDTATVLTKEEKELLEKGSLHIVAKMESNEMKMSMKVPFKNVQQLLYLKQHMFEMVDKLKAEKKLFGNGQPEGEDDSMADENMPDAGMGGGPEPGNLLHPAQEAFSFNIEKNTISNKLTNKDVFDNWVVKDSSMQMVMQMIPFMGDFNYTTTFILPSPVKKYSGGSESKLSDDKKTITFINSLSGLMEKPESFEYSFEY
ncbi:hypothetical protein BH10BAC2_BH10BAC2_31060 [soil metagenome]